MSSGNDLKQLTSIYVLFVFGHLTLIMQITLVSSTGTSLKACYGTGGCDIPPQRKKASLINYGLLRYVNGLEQGEDELGSRGFEIFEIPSESP